ncbi:MAG: phosphoenolpyruvate synthase [Actinobacteria bacterium]|nr:phosphoenolpyruvate synthase [Actinomycetota bacterium]
MAKQTEKHIRWFKDITAKDIPIVGGKNASLGEMIQKMKKGGVNVPDGFATTADTYWKFLEENNLFEKIKEQINKLKKGENLEIIGRNIRSSFSNARFPEEIRNLIIENYNKLSKKYDTEEVDVAVRSSSTAEDLPKASFAGAQESFLNISGAHELLESCKKCFTSLFTDRAIIYREEKNFSHLEVALSIGIQKMVRSDKGSSGVMFTLDTETGFNKIVEINAAWGLGEYVVQGTVNPDEYDVFKPLLGKKNIVPVLNKYMGSKERKLIYGKGGSHKTKNAQTSRKEQRSFVLQDKEIIQLAEWAVKIEKHYGRPMDIEWAKDGITNKIFIVQARPETVQSLKIVDRMRSYSLKERGKIIVTGKAIGDSIGAAKASVIASVDDIDKFKEGTILVTGMTDPDWVPIMKKAVAIITDHGGRTSHAAIVSRELGLPAVVGTGDGTKKIKDDQEITVSCIEGDDGFVYEGILKYEVRDIDLKDIPKTKTKIMMNIASPDAAIRWWRLPCQGIGLARMEFIISNIIKIHPMALVKYDELKDPEVKRKIDAITEDYKDKKEYFIENLALGIAQIAATRYPDPVIVRMSDFKTNEYANLLGGQGFEPIEENPMLGFRGASRYYNARYLDGFKLECEAIKRARDKIGLDNVVMMIPFCRTISEADKVLEVLKKNGMERGKNNLKVYIMAEIPSNVIQAEEFAKRFDGFSIGSNDLTQLVLGIDRDSEILSELFDERNESVKMMIKLLIKDSHKVNTPVGICGQAPSDYPEFAEFLVENKIDSISLNPDSVIKTIDHVYKKEKRNKK